MNTYKNKNIIFFLIFLLFNPSLFNALFKKIYLPTLIQFYWLKKYRIKTIVDVGGYKGETSKALNFLFPKAKIYIFEPIKENSRIIAKKLENADITISNQALSNQKEKHTFYQNEYAVLSSLYKINPKQKLYSSYHKTKEFEVQTTTLDSYFSKITLKKDIFLKIDTQGTEKEVLQGGSNFLKKVSIIHLEVSFEEFYKGQSLFNEIFNFLTLQGFIYFGESKESEFYPIFGPKKQVNALFFNKKILVK